MILRCQGFKEEIENRDQPGGPLLDVTDIKMIFGNIPPIYDVHMKIRDELNGIVLAPETEHSIGDVILKHVRTGHVMNAIAGCMLPLQIPNPGNYFSKSWKTGNCFFFCICVQTLIV